MATLVGFEASELPMSSGLTSTLSEFSRKSEFTTSPLAGEPAAAAPRRGGASPGRFGTRMRRWAGAVAAAPLRFLSSHFLRYLLAFGLGAAAMAGWQSWGNGARRTVAAMSPRLAFLAPPATAGITSEQMKATSRALAAVHQSVDKLSSEINRMEAQGSTDAVAPSSSERSERRSSRR